MTTRHVLVVGGGIAGLTAAHRIRQLAGSNTRVTIAERAGQLGGKLRTTRLAGVAVETGAESFLVRRPEATELVDTLGLGEQLIHPAPLPAAVYSYGKLHNIPKGTLQGVPSDPAALAGIVSREAANRAETASSGPFLTASDATVGALVRRAFGEEVTQRLVDPMLGGVYAGRADDLSVEVTMPGLAAAARDHNRLSAAVTQCLPQRAADPPAPVFGALAGGMSRLVDALAAASDAEILLGKPIRQLRRTPSGWQAVRGDTREPELIDADAVVLAIPSSPAARLLRDLDPHAANDIAQLDYASVALAALAYRGVHMPDLAGFLVPAVEGFGIKAVTFVTQKWPHLAGGDDVTIVRASLGRYGEERLLQRDDAELLSLAHHEISTLVGLTLPPAADGTVFRWGGGLPQYTPGHRDRIARVRRRLAAYPLALAGAAYDGVGIPACVASGQAAAGTLLDPQTGVTRL